MYQARGQEKKNEASRPHSTHTPSKSVLRLCAALRWGGCGQNEAEDKGTDYCDENENKNLKKKKRTNACVEEQGKGVRRRETRLPGVA